MIKYILLLRYVWGGVESNEYRIDFYRIFRIIFHLSNQSNHKFSNRIERISNESSIWKIWLHPIVGVESNRTNFELIFIEFFEYFLPFRINRIANFRIESNEFRTNSNLTPPLPQVPIFPFWLRLCSFYALLTYKKKGRKILATVGKMLEL